jgi:hypothetical protein
MTPDQCRNARRLLGWSRGRLGRASRTPDQFIAAYEHTGRIAVPKRGGSGAARIARMRVTLEEAGVTFSAVDVRLRKPDP